MLHQLESVITKTSDLIWPIFVPFMLILGVYMAYTTIFKIQPKLTKPSKLKFKNLIVPCVDQDVWQLETSYATDRSINSKFALEIRTEGCVCACSVY